MPDLTEEILKEVKSVKEVVETQVSEVKVGMGEAEKRFMAELAARDARIAELEKLLMPRKASVAGLEDYAKEFYFTRAIYAIMTNDWSHAGFEKEVFDETRKTMDATVGASGAYIVPTQVLGGLIGLLEAAMVVKQAGATVLPGLIGSPVELTRQTGGATAYWVGENQALTPSDLSFGAMSLTPKGVGALVKMSNRLIRLSSPGIEGIVRQDIALRVAQKIDLAALRGQGTEYQPLGVANYPGINTVVIGASGGNIDFDKLIDMEGTLEDDNALAGNLAYIWAPCTKRNLLKLKVKQYSGATGVSSDSAYIVQPVTEQQLQAWIGYPYLQTTAVPTNLTKGGGTDLTEIYFGNWAELLIGQWGGMEIMASQETSDAFEKVQTWIRVIQEVDCQVRHPESFCLINDANKTNT